MQTEKPTAQEQFGRVAENYLVSAAHNRPDALAKLVNSVNRRGGRVLDVGTGAGLTAYAFAPTVDEVIALDVTPEMLEIVNRESQTRGLSNITTQCATAEELPFEKDELDGIVTRMAAHHFTDVSQFVRECARVLRPGGWLAVVDTVGTEDAKTNSQIDEIESLRDPSHVRDIKPSEWRKMIEQAGFSVRIHETVSKSLDLEDWLTRMEVPAPTGNLLRARMKDSTGALREYLSPVIKDGRNYFHLHEMMLVADLEEQVL